MQLKSGRYEKKPNFENTRLDSTRLECKLFVQQQCDTTKAKENERNNENKNNNWKQ